MRNDGSMKAFGRQLEVSIEVLNREQRHCE
jgi:hypothetical protein